MSQLYLFPHFGGQDKGDGGIRRVVEAQERWLPEFGWTITKDMKKADLVATHAGNLLNVPIDVPWVVHTHGLYWAEYEWYKWHLDLNKQVIQAMHNSDHVTAPSEWVGQVLRRHLWIEPTILYHGIDLEDWQPGRSRGYVLWNKTRTDPVCDPAPVNELAAMDAKIKYLTTFGDAAANVKVTGKLPYLEAKKLIQNAGVYLCTARETFGIGTLEAMACGVPVVGWDWGGQREIIEHGVTGWLARPGDHDDLLEGVRWALDNRKAIKEACLSEIPNWTWPEAVKRYASLYNQITSIPKGPLVSIVIPCYNLGRYLPDAIRSLQAQTFQDWEAIIVNDASPDDTQEIALALATEDSRIRVINNTDNQYLAGACGRRTQRC